MEIFILGLLTIPAILLIKGIVEIFAVKCKHVRRLPTNVLFKAKNLPVRHLFGRFFWKDSILIIGSRVPTKEEKQFLKRDLTNEL